VNAKQAKIIDFWTTPVKGRSFYFKSQQDDIGIDLKE